MLGSGSTLFAQQKPGGLFGNTGNNATFNTAGTFGSSTFGTNTNVGTGIGTGLLGAGYYIKFFIFDFYRVYIYIYISKSIKKYIFIFRSNINQTKSSGTVPVHQQILALVSAPFGDSPLLKNLLPVNYFLIFALFLYSCI